MAETKEAPEKKATDSRSIPLVKRLESLVDPQGFIKEVGIRSDSTALGVSGPVTIVNLRSMRVLKPGELEVFLALKKIPYDNIHSDPMTNQSVAFFL